jgi:hypothetical protein
MKTAIREERQVLDCEEGETGRSTVH